MLFSAVRFFRESYVRRGRLSSIFHSAKTLKGVILCCHGREYTPLLYVFLTELLLGIFYMIFKAGSFFMPFSSIMLIYLTTVNIFIFFLMLADKNLAVRRRRRVPESTLLLFCFAGGAVGCLFAMYLFRHKTLHKKFTVGVPLILIFQIIIVVLIVSSYNSAF